MFGGGGGGTAAQVTGGGSTQDQAEDEAEVQSFSLRILVF